MNLPEVSPNEQNPQAFIIISVIFAAAAFFLPVPAGLAVKGWYTLLLMVYTIALWATEAIAPSLTAVLVMALLSLTGILSFPKAVAGFGDTTIWLLIGVYIISAAMRESGLDRRIALNMINLAKGQTSTVVLMANVTTSIFVFLLPASSGRASLITPICLGIIKAMGLAPGSNIAKSLLISVSYTSLVGSMGLITGAVSMAYAASLFEIFLGFKLTYLRWLQIMLPASLVCGLLMSPLLLRIFPPELRDLPGGSHYIRKEMAALGPMATKERKVIAILGLTILCWIFEDRLNISVAQSCLLASIALVLPGTGIISWKKATAAIEWGAIFVLGASLAMVEALKSTKAIEWLTSLLFSSLPAAGYVVHSILLMLMLILIRLCFPNILAMTATTIPIMFSMAPALGFNPVWLGLLGVGGTVIGLLLPTQSITHLITFAAGYYSTADMFKAGKYTSFLVAAIILLFAHLYWPLLGIPPLASGR